MVDHGDSGELRAAKERLRIVRAWAAAIRQWPSVARVVHEAEDDETARRAVADLLDLDDLQARAVLDLQLRRVSRQQRQTVDAMIRELEATIESLESRP